MALLLLTASCGVPLAVGLPVAGAAFGFGAAALTFDTEALKVWDERTPPRP
jgi:hypothetical protein